MSYNVDAIILIVIGIFFLMGFVKGFIKQIGSIIGFFLALWVAATFYPQFAAYLKPSFQQWQIIASQLSVFVAYILLFFGTQFAFGILVSIADYLFRIFSFAPFMKLTNRLLGGLIGAIEGILIVSAAFALLTQVTFFPVLSQKLKKSFFAPFASTISGIIMPLLPDLSRLTPTLPSLPGGLDLKSIDFKSLNIDSINLDSESLKDLNIDQNSKEFQQLKGLLETFLKKEQPQQQK